MKLLTLSCLILISAINQASAATVNYTQDRRYTRSSGSDGAGTGYNNITNPSAPYADMAVPGQNSKLGPNGFTASGSGSAYSQYSNSLFMSVFDISFSVAGSTRITLSGLLQGEDILYGSGDASVFLYKGDNTLLANQLYGESVQASYGYLSADIAYSSILNAGEYRLVATADPYYQQASSSFSLNAILTPVPVPEPEPAAAWLFGSGLLILIGASAKRRRC